MNILALETSCDETSAALVQVKNQQIKILANIIGSQIKLHKKYGGVVPELAARRHTELIVPVINQVFKKAGKGPNFIDKIAVTYGPGLAIALLVGMEAAKSLAFAWKIPLIGVNHLEGHLYSILALPKLNFNFFNQPVISLIVSGGHTELLLVKGFNNYELLGKTRDDAAGEAFDKVARMLGLSYPGGPAISKAAKKGSLDSFDIPRPMLQSKDYDFSFSGLKTHFLYLIKKFKKQKKGNLDQKTIANLAANFQEAVVDVLVFKTISCALEQKVQKIVVTGGVCANLRLRQKMKKQAKTAGLQVFFPSKNLAGDNAAMIAIAGYLRTFYNCSNDLFNLSVKPNLKLC